MFQYVFQIFKLEFGIIIIPPCLLTSSNQPIKSYEDTDSQTVDPSGVSVGKPELNNKMVPSTNSQKDFSTNIQTYVDKTS